MFYLLNKKITLSGIAIFLFTMNLWSQCPPEVLYYKFQDNMNSATRNFGIPGMGSQMAQVLGNIIGTGGEFDSCMVGIGGVNNYVNTGWATNIGLGNWTISFWVNNLADNNPTYIFGDPSINFRCFYGGAAGNQNILLRGNFTDVLINNVMPGPTVIHIVYNGTSIKIYRNGILQSTNIRAAIILSGAGPFEVGGMENHNCLNSGGLMDEFRFYNRALTQTEISSTWNMQLNCLTGIEKNQSIPEKFGLSQNYPNPFNPVTLIKYDIPKSTQVKLTVYNELGTEVAVVVNKTQPAGNYSIRFDGSNYSSGIYFYKIETPEFVQTKKMILVK